MLIKFVDTMMYLKPLIELNQNVNNNREKGLDATGSPLIELNQNVN